MKGMITIVALVAFVGTITGSDSGESHGAFQSPVLTLAPLPTVTISDDALFYKIVDKDKVYRWNMDITIDEPSSFERSVHIDPERSVVLVKLRRLDGDQRIFRNYPAIRYEDEVKGVSRFILKVLDSDGTTELASIERYTKGAVFEPK